MTIEKQNGKGQNIKSLKDKYQFKKIKTYKALKDIDNFFSETKSHLDLSKIGKLSDIPTSKNMLSYFPNVREIKKK